MTKKTKQRKTHLYMPGIDEADPVPDFSPQDLYLIASVAESRKALVVKVKDGLVCFHWLLCILLTHMLPYKMCARHIYIFKFARTFFY